MIILISMNHHSISTELRQAALAAVPSIDFRPLIAKQQDVIASLQEEILMLKSYISLQRTPNISLDLSCQDCSLAHTSSTLGSAILNPLLEESVHFNKSQHDSFIHQLAEVLEVPKDAQDLHQRLMEAARKYKEQATAPRQPTFVEKIKQIRMPITVEKIVEKPVEKIVEKIVEKVVYIDSKLQEDRQGYRPAFREKNDSYRDKNKGFNAIHEQPRDWDDEPERALNKSYSEKNMNKRRPEPDREWESRYQGQKFGGNLKRRGGDRSRHYKQDYY